MTALKPIENRRVRGVAAERYPINETCAHPECAEPAVDPHHIFPRSAIGGDSWFVEITPDTVGYHGPYQGSLPDQFPEEVPVVIPHVSGLCREHHDAVEQHAAWIKLEEIRGGGSEFVWYDRNQDGEVDRGDGQEMMASDDPDWQEWVAVGPLDPQPGGRAKSRKPRRKFRGEARRKRKTISLRVPDDAGEDGAGLLEDKISQLEDRRSGDGKPRPIYYTISEALDYTLLNAGPEDFE